MMRSRLGWWCVLALWLGVLLAGATAQEAAKPPVLTIEEAVMVEAVQALQAQAQKACTELKEVKGYQALVQKATRALAAKGKQMDWATGKVSAIPPTK